MEVVQGHLHPPFLVRRRRVCVPNIQPDHVLVQVAAAPDLHRSGASRLRRGIQERLLEFLNLTTSGIGTESELIHCTIEYFAFTERVPDGPCVHSGADPAVRDHRRPHCMLERSARLRQDGGRPIGGLYTLRFTLTFLGYLKILPTWMGSLTFMPSVTNRLVNDVTSLAIRSLRLLPLLAIYKKVRNKDLKLFVPHEPLVEPNA